MRFLAVALTALSCIMPAARAQSPMPTTGLDRPRAASDSGARIDSAQLRVIREREESLARRVRQLDSAQALVEARDADLASKFARADTLVRAAERANNDATRLGALSRERDSLRALAALSADRQSQRDSLARLSLSLEAQLKARAGWTPPDTTCAPYSGNGLFPVRSTLDAVCFWRQGSMSALSTATLSAASDQSSAYVEVLAYTMKLLHGSVAGVVASSKDSTKNKSDLQRLIAGGGSSVFGLALPVAMFADAAQTYYSSVILSPRVGVDLPALGSTARTGNTSYDLGADAIFKATSYENNLGVVLHLRSGWITGSADYFQRLGLTDSHRFNYATYALGVTIQQAYVITVSRPFWGPSVLQELGTQIGVTAYRSR
jgi:hypothetical protein